MNAARPAWIMAAQAKRLSESGFEPTVFLSAGHGMVSRSLKPGGDLFLETSLGFLMNGLDAVGKTAGGSGELFVVGDEGFSQRSVKVTKDMENLKKASLPVWK